MPVPSRRRRRFRSWVRRSSLVWWASVAVLALTTAMVVRSSIVRTSALADRYGALEAVPVVVAPVPAGAAVDAASVRMEERPSGTVPSGAATAADVDSGRTALVPLVPGEVLLTARLAPDGLRGAAALLPRGMRAVAVPGGPGGRPPVEIGDRVDLLATLLDAAHDVATPVAGDAGDAGEPPEDETSEHHEPVDRPPPSGGPASAPTFVVAAAAVVLAVDPESDTVTVAVAPHEVAAVVHAVATGSVTLALTAP